MTTFNNNVFNSRNLLIAVIVIVAIMLLGITFRGCYRAPLHKEDAKQVRVVQEQLQQVEQAKAADSTRLVRQADSLLILALDYKNKREAAEKELAHLRSDRQRISDKLDTARANRDTAGFISACDSLQERTHVQDEVIALYVRYVDSVDAVQQAQLTVKDSLLQNRQVLISQLRSTNHVTYEKYNQLSADYRLVNRKLKRERTLSRVLAAGALVLGGLLITK